MIDRELGPADFARAIPRRMRERLMAGEIEGGKDIVALRRFAGLTQTAFASALGISVHTLRNWEQDRRRPDGPALHCSASPHVIRGCSRELGGDRSFQRVGIPF